MGVRAAFIWIVVLLVVVVAGLFVWRSLDYRNSSRVMARLLAPDPVTPLLYSPEMVADQPEPVRRFFNYAIAIGTPLNNSVALELEGQFNMGPKAEPHIYSMFAKEVINYPDGFVWQVVLRTDEM